MDLIRLPAGETAPVNTDCIKINMTTMGDYTLVASALMVCGDGDDAESVALVGSAPYLSYEEAEGAGLAWAEAHCVATMDIETGGGSEPAMPKASL